MRFELPGAQLRPFRRGDEADLVRAANHREIWRNVRDGFPFPYRHEDAQRWVAYNEAIAPVLNFAVEHERSVVGGIGLLLGNDVHRYSAEIGYWLAPSVWGKGIGTAAVVAVTNYGLEQLGLVRIHGGVFAWNPASVRVLEKAGYRCEGLMRAWAFKDGQNVDAWLYAKIKADAEGSPAGKPG